MSRKKVRLVDIPDDPTEQERQALVERAQYTALWHLGQARKTEGQIRQVLERKGFTDEYVAPVLQMCRENGYLDDEAFAQDYAESRLQRFGARRVQQDLSQRGVDRELIAQVLERELERRQDHETDSPHEVAYRLVRPKIESWQGLDSQKIKTRALGFLTRRGFDFSVSNSAISRCLSEDAERE